MKHDYFGSAKSDSEGYEELLTASRDRALQSAEILEAWVLTAGSLVDVVDIGLTLQDLGNSELSAGQKTLAVVGAALPIISGRVLTIGNKRCIPRDAPKRIPVPEGHTRVYRAVSEAEYQDILKTGQLRQGPNSMMGKWFADTPEGVRLHGDALEGAGKYRIIEVDIPDNLPSLHFDPNLDLRGPARYLDAEDLINLKPRLFGG